MPETNHPRRKAVLVLGMHRSGTSLLSGLISKAGFYIGKTVMSPAEDNPKGFFENQQIVNFNEQLLISLGLSWSSWQRLPDGWQSLLDASEKEAAAALIDEEFGDARLICIKDPRMCRLFPIWSEVLSEKEFDVFLVFSTRGLSEVSASLQHRDGMSPEQAEALWARYNLDALHNSEGAAGVHVSYRDLLSDAESTLSRVSHLVGEKLEIADKGFVDSTLRHHEEKDTPSWATRLVENSHRFPAPPEPLFEDIVFPLLDQMASLSRNMADVLAGDISSGLELEGKEAALFVQAEEAKRHALSLSKELETGRSYIDDLEREHRDKNKLIKDQEATLQDMRLQSEEFIASLQTSLDQSREYVASLEQTLAKKELDFEAAITDFEKDRSLKDEYAQSLIVELGAKEADLEAQGADLSLLNDALKIKETELAESHQRCHELEERLRLELEKFRIQRKIFKMFKRESDG